VNIEAPLLAKIIIECEFNTIKVRCKAKKKQKNAQTILGDHGVAVINLMN
jgi:hypothetical protein